MAVGRSCRTEGTCSGSLRSRDEAVIRGLVEAWRAGRDERGWPATHRGYACGPAAAAPWQISWNSESIGSVALWWGGQKRGWVVRDGGEAQRGEQAGRGEPSQAEGNHQRRSGELRELWTDIVSQKEHGTWSREHELEFRLDHLLAV